jgi:hypothetical protein
MPKGFRLVVIAVVGWLSLVAAGAAPNGKVAIHKGGAHQTLSKKLEGITPAVEKQDAIPSPDGGCERGKDDRKSDLCAQWKAADAAFDAAASGRQQVNIGIIGLILGAATMIAAIAAALYAKRAAVATEQTVQISRDATNAAFLVQRPWIDVEVTAKGFCLISGKVDMRALVTTKNIGSAPATSLAIHCKAHIMTLDMAEDGPFSIESVFESRDRFISERVDATIERLRSSDKQLRGMFPGEIDDSYESFYMGESYQGDIPCGFVVAAISYKFPGGRGETVKVFWIRYIDIQNTDDHPARATHSEVDMKLQPWPQFGHIT